MGTILIVEDDIRISRLLKQILNQAGYTPLLASNITEAVSALHDNYIHLVLLDWMLGKEDGMDVYRIARRNNSLRDIPFILLTAKTSDQDQVYGLDQGVADYITKPFSNHLLLARLRSVLQHHPRSTEQEIKVGKLCLNFTKNTLSANNGQSVSIDPSDCRMLALLMKSPGKSISRKKLANTISVTNQQIELRTVDVHISRIRKKLKKLGAEKQLSTVRSQGYMFKGAFD